VCRLTTLICLAFCSLICRAENLADPTRPLQYSAPADAASQSQAIELTSILIASDRRLAIINGQTLRELQTVKGVGAVVKKIEADAVVLQQGDKVWRIALNNTAIRK
jgi:MSHA biogenesis protein MshK